MLDSSGTSSSQPNRSMFRRASLIVLAVAFVAVLAGAIGFGAMQLAGVTIQDAPTATAAIAGPSATTAPAAYVPVTRTYYIAADTVKWNFAPDGKNDITGEPFGDRENTYLKTGRNRIGSINFMSQYRQYTDDTFKTLVPRSADDAYMGLLGPTIHAVVGDTIVVVFKNNTPFPASVHPHGVFYAKDSEGAPYDDGTSGAGKDDDAVPTGGTHTYRWLVPDRAGPGPGDGSSILWMYHSHTDEVGDTNAGLLGDIVITRAEDARPDGTPKDVDRELFTNFEILDQNVSPYLQMDIHTFTSDPKSVDTSDDEFVESNLKHSINGYVYGNMPMITIKEGEKVRWYVTDLGTEVDLHTPHWHGNTVLVMGLRTDMVMLLPGMMVVADMVPDDPGIWLYHCHVNDHILAGMQTRYQVLPA